MLMFLNLKRHVARSNCVLNLGFLKTVTKPMNLLDSYKRCIELLKCPIELSRKLYFCCRIPKDNSKDVKKEYSILFNAINLD